MGLNLNFNAKLEQERLEAEKKAEEARKLMEKYAWHRINNKNPFWDGSDKPDDKKSRYPYNIEEFNCDRNRQAKRAIIEAFFTLLIADGFSDITVTDIVKQAGVSRSSYYRNFFSKIDILDQTMFMIEDDILERVDPSGGKGLPDKKEATDILNDVFTIMLKNKAYVMGLYKSGFSSKLLIIMNDCVSRLLGVPDRKSMKRYKMSWLAGGLYAAVIEWLNSGAAESPNTMARCCADILFPEDVDPFI
jgi:AcrR family transcriptional regulator